MMQALFSKTNNNCEHFNFLNNQHIFPFNQRKLGAKVIVVSDLSIVFLAINLEGKIIRI